MIKLNGVQRGVVGEIISRFGKKGFSLKGLKMITVERTFAERHYQDLSAKPLFNGLVDYIISDPVVAMIWEGKNVVITTGRKITGATNPEPTWTNPDNAPTNPDNAPTNPDPAPTNPDSAPETIRGDFAIEIGRNVIHGSPFSCECQEGNCTVVPRWSCLLESSLHPWIYE